MSTLKNQAHFLEIHEHFLKKGVRENFLNPLDIF